VDWIDKAVFCSAMFLIVVGLIFEASGFGILVVGRLDGIILIVMGITMFWGGWVMSGAHGSLYTVAAVLNMFDAASTISFWNYEVNPLVHIAGPTIFLAAKVMCSITIMLYARLHHSTRVAGMLLTLFFGLIVGWNLGQHALAYLGLRVVSHQIFVLLVGATISLGVSMTAILLLFLRRQF
jgi:hypothetical protein